MLSRSKFVVCASLLTAAPGHAKAAIDESGASSPRTMHISMSTASVKRIPLQRAKRAILLPATIGGQPVFMLFDNGSNITVIDERLARDNGFKSDGFSANLDSGVSAIPTKRVDARIVVGDAITLSGQMAAADLGPMSRALGRPVAGIIGADAVAGLVVVVDPVDGWMAFGVPGHLDTVSQTRAPAPNSHGGTIASARMPTMVPFGPDYGIAAAVNGSPVRLEIDYGSTGAITLRDDIWQRVIPVTARSGEITASTRADGREMKERVGTASELAFGRVSIRNVPAISQISNRIRYEGLLGLGVLASTTTILDTPEHNLWIFPEDQTVSVSAAADK